MKNKFEGALPRLLVTMGEPAGIGPELIVKIAQLDFSAQLVVLADPELLLSTARKLSLPLKLTEVDWAQGVNNHLPGHLYIETFKTEEPVIAGELNLANAKTTLSILGRASELALQQKVDAIVTAPVHKANLNHLDSSFLGHTEFFAERANLDKVVMMLASGNLRIALATTHLPLSEVSAAITQESLKQVINVILDGFEQLQIEGIKLAVCGLNPHAGEEGLLGTEEIDTITPLLLEYQKQNKNVFGPFPADTLFTPQKRQDYDVFLAMYHDQGLPVVKAFGFGECANITLGLPYIRTSVDHGTALDIAADYCASADSLEYAINYAIQLAAGKLP